MIKVYARVDGGIVWELIEVPDGLDVFNMFAPQILEQLVEVTGRGVQQNWVAYKDSDGKWHFSEPPPPSYTDDQLAMEVRGQRDQQLQLAAIRIAPLQDAVDLGESTPAEEKLLKQWKQFRIALNRIEAQAGFPRDVTWPVEPS